MTDLNLPDGCSVNDLPGYNDELESVEDLAQRVCSVATLKAAKAMLDMVGDVLSAACDADELLAAHGIMSRIQNDVEDTGGRLRVLAELRDEQ